MISIYLLHVHENPEKGRGGGGGGGGALNESLGRGVPQRLSNPHPIYINSDLAQVMI